MTIFFIGDTHFGHKNIIQFDATKENRKFPSIEEHDEELVRRWNSVVGKNDTVWVLGDFAFGSKNIDIAGRLKGHKKLVLGNHDLYPSAKYLKYFQKLYGAVPIEGFILTHIPVHPDQLKRYGRNIHGHLHTNKVEAQQNLGSHAYDENYICVSAEQINLTPIALEALP